MKNSEFFYKNKNLILSKTLKQLKKALSGVSGMFCPKVAFSISKFERGFKVTYQYFTGNQIFGDGHFMTLQTEMGLRKKDIYPDYFAEYIAEQIYQHISDLETSESHSAGMNSFSHLCL